MLKVLDNKYTQRIVPNYTITFWIKVTLAIFQQIMDTVLHDCEFSIPYLDDVLIKSNSREQHGERIKAALFTLSEGKCEFFLSIFKYMLQIIDKSARRPDSSRADAIRNMPAPTNIPNLQVFLGLANYYQNYIPNMHKIVHADCLLWLIPQNMEETVIVTLQAESEIRSIMTNVIQQLPATTQNIKMKAIGDEYITEIKEALKNNQNKTSDASRFSICDDILIYAQRVVVPITFQKYVLQQFHSGHLGMTRMKALMRNYVYLPSMDRDIKKLG
ncbi:uncharacterized protein K02A2.6-like [Octopus bimaculoides]|uniref:uncharacterized protein K02A2.6-like n=1 Tax=Octopus bimaculoides TaxID=37653 RepID=UPI00071DC96B|nr:uncharacterized protein K02A2.6-like [Octopus bimaculoides]|eukprot:XP_014789760.1 PREDICTED: uncharacterized protein K02A2.6-like [Octopus bimaculoides]